MKTFSTFFVCLLVQSKNNLQNRFTVLLEEDRKELETWWIRLCRRCIRSHENKSFHQKMLGSDWMSIFDLDRIVITHGKQSVLISSTAILCKVLLILGHYYELEIITHTHTKIAFYGRIIGHCSGFSQIEKLNLEKSTNHSDPKISKSYWDLKNEEKCQWTETKIPSSNLSINVYTHNILYRKANELNTIAHSIYYEQNVD